MWMFLPARRKDKKRLQGADLADAVCACSAPPPVHSCKGFSARYHISLVPSMLSSRGASLDGCARVFYSEVMTPRPGSAPVRSPPAARNRVCPPLTVSSASKGVKHGWGDKSFEPHQHMNDSRWQYLLFNTRAAVSDPDNKSQLHICPSPPLSRTQQRRCSHPLPPPPPK